MKTNLENLENWKEKLKKYCKEYVPSDNIGKMKRIINQSQYELIKDLISNLLSQQRKEFLDELKKVQHGVLQYNIRELIKKYDPKKNKWGKISSRKII